MRYTRLWSSHIKPVRTPTHICWWRSLPYKKFLLRNFLHRNHDTLCCKIFGILGPHILIKGVHFKENICWLNTAIDNLTGVLSDNRTSSMKDLCPIVSNSTYLPLVNVNKLVYSYAWEIWKIMYFFRSVVFDYLYE